MDDDDGGGNWRGTNWKGPYSPHFWLYNVDPDPARDARVVHLKSVYSAWKTWLDANPWYFRKPFAEQTRLWAIHGPKEQPA